MKKNILSIICCFFLTPLVLANGFPPLSGKYRIGNRSHFISSDAHDFGGVMVDIWYPTELLNEGEEQQAESKYQSSSTRILLEKLKSQKMRQITLEVFSQLRVYGIRDALPISYGKYPLIIYSHGLDMDRLSSTYLCESLASQGYIVVSIDHADYAAEVQFPNGSVTSFNQWDYMISKSLQRKADINSKNEIKFIIESFNPEKSHPLLEDFQPILDFNRIGMFGHSYGGGNTLAILLEEPRVKAGLSLDGTLSRKPIGEQLASFAKPVEVIFGEDALARRNKDFPTLEVDGTHPELQVQNIVTQGPESSARVIVTQGTEHFTFTDRLMIHQLLSNSMQLIQKEPDKKDDFLNILSRKFKVGNCDAQKNIKLITNLLETFFKKNL